VVPCNLKRLSLERNLATRMRPITHEDGAPTVYAEVSQERVVTGFTIYMNQNIPRRTNARGSGVYRDLIEFPGALI
jgi:hypothetical protein